GRSGGRLRARSLHYWGTGTEISSGGLKMVMNASPRFLRPSLIATAALAAAVTLAPQAAQARGSSRPGGGGGEEPLQRRKPGQQFPRRRLAQRRFSRRRLAHRWVSPSRLGLLPVRLGVGLGALLLLVVVGRPERLRRDGQ